MKLSFSTRGWLDLSWTEMLDSAIDMGFHGIEVYNLHICDQLTDRSGPFHKYQVAATVRQLREKGLHIPCFDTSIDLSAPDCDLDALSSVMEVAHNSQVPYIACCALSDQEDLVLQRLSALVRKAETMDLVLLIKTSCIYADSARLRKVLDHFASDSLAA